MDNENFDNVEFEGDTSSSDNKGALVAAGLTLGLAFAAGFVNAFGHAAYRKIDRAIANHKQKRLEKEVELIVIDSVVEEE